MSETVSPVVIHRLTNKDLETLTGDCSVCGLVAIRKSGTGFQCATKKAMSRKAWVQSNPQKAAENRALKSEHELFNRDYQTLTAECAVCGPVDLVMYGAGYACGIRSRELRSVQQESPVGARCRECAIIDGPAQAPRLRADGSCPRCAEGPDAYSPRHTPAERRDRGGEASALSEQFGQAGFSVYVESFDEYELPPVESVVPGWRTIGSDVRPWNEV